LLRSKDARVLESDAWNFANNDEDEEDDIRRDESSGEVLPTKLVMEARQEELEFFKEKKVWKFVLITEAIRVTGKQPISVRWIDINKGDGDTMQIRSRLVAREMANRKSDEFFSATPPLEAKECCSVAWLLARRRVVRKRNFSSSMSAERTSMLMPRGTPTTSSRRSCTWRARARN
jgi:hypothetical protein